MPLVLEINDRLGIPASFALHQNYPNPFNPTSTIRFDLPVSGKVDLIVYDMLGREVTRLVEGTKQAGYHQVIWDGRYASGRQVASGIYFARLVTPKYTKVMKMLMLK